MADYTGGFTGAVNSMQQRALAAQQAEHLKSIVFAAAEAHRRLQEQRAARQGAGSIFSGMAQSPREMPPQMGPPPPALAPPGTTPGPIPPQVGQASVPAAGVAPPAALSAEAPPYQAMPEEPTATGGGEGEIAPPPAGAPATPAAVATAQPAKAQGLDFDVRGFVGEMKKQGVPSELMTDMLDAAAPRLNDQARTDIKLLTIQNTAIKLAHDYAVRQVAELRKQQDTDSRARLADIRQQEADRRQQQGDERNQILRDRLNAKLLAAGGPGKLSGQYYVMGTDENGGQIILGTGGKTAGGKMVEYDTNGTQVDVNSLKGTRSTAGQFGMTIDRPIRARERTVAADRAELDALERQTTKTPADKARMDALKKSLASRPAGAAPGAPAATGGAAPPTDPAQREVGKVYTLPRGKFKWTAGGWVPA